MGERDLRNKKNVRIGLIGARKNMGLTQQKLADRALISRSLLAHLEVGTRNACDDTWKRLKKELRVKSVEELWERFNYADGWFEGDDGSRIRDPKYKKDVQKE